MIVAQNEALASSSLRFGCVSFCLRMKMKKKRFKMRAVLLSKGKRNPMSLDGVPKVK